MKNFKAIIKSVLVIIAVLAAFVVFLVLAMAYGEPSTYDKMQEQRWEESYHPYGG